MNEASWIEWEKDMKGIWSICRGIEESPADDRSSEIGNSAA